MSVDALDNMPTPVSKWSKIRKVFQRLNERKCSVAKDTEIRYRTCVGKQDSFATLGV
jgi:hypothetical protein